MKLSLNQKLSPRSAGALIVLGLLVSVVATQAGTGSRGPVEVATPVAAETPRAPSPGRTTLAAADLDLDKLRRPAAPEGPVTELFAARVQAPPQADGGSGAPAAAAGPPALPFQYLGKLIEAGRLKVFLGRDNQLYTVSPGQTLDKLYKVERVTEEAVTFTYIPMGASQSLAIPARG